MGFYLLIRISLSVGLQMVDLSPNLSDTVVLVNLLITCFIGMVIVHESITIGKRKKERSQLELMISETNKQTSDNNKEISNNNKEISNKELEIKNKVLEFQKTELDFKKKESDFKMEALEKVKTSTEDISKRITDRLIEDQTWLDRFMDETGATYGGSVFGTRINHFYYEKKALARKAIDILQEEVTNNKEMKYCILIDSGTTTYHLFCEICYRIKNNRNLAEKNCFWTDRIVIITNNLPGIQYLMKHCKKEYDEYSDLLIKCLLLPGEPLPVYGAVTGIDTINFLEKDHIKDRIKDILEVKNVNQFQIISFLPSNYMVRHPEKIDGKELYCPVARGGGEGGHFDIKNKFAELSDKIYLISPLTKFSFATCEDLNRLNKLDIDEKEDPHAERKNPDRVKYREVELITDELMKKCNFIITDRRAEKDLFWSFANELRKSLEKSYSKNKIYIANYNVEQWIPVDIKNPYYTDLEMKREIPHTNLRNAYLEKKTDGRHFIWDYSWVYRREEEKY